MSVCVLKQLRKSSLRPEAFSPKTVNLTGRGLALRGQILLEKRPLRCGETGTQRRRRTRNFLDHLRDTARSVAEKLAQ